MEQAYYFMGIGALLILSSVILGFVMARKIREHQEYYDITVFELESDMGGILKSYVDYRSKIRRDIRTNSIELCERIWKTSLLGHPYQDFKWRELEGEEHTKVRKLLFDKKELEIFLDY